MKRVAVLDDNLGILQAMQTLLEIEGFEVDTFSHYKALERGIERNSYDVFILDIMLNEEEDGFSVCQKLKNNPKTTDVPVLLFSAHTHGSIERKLQAMGCAEFMEKPFDADDMIKKVDKLSQTCH